MATIDENGQTGAKYPGPVSLIAEYDPEVRAQQHMWVAFFTALCEQTTYERLQTSL